MQAALQAGLKSPIGKQVVSMVVSELAFPAVKYVAKRVAPIIVSDVKAGAVAMKDCGSQAREKMARRYGEPNRSFIVTEQAGEKDGYRYVSVSRDLDEEFLRTWYPV